MPLYEYQCETCGAIVEKLRPVSAPDAGPHEDCGGELKKLVSTPRVTVKENDGTTGSTHSSILRFNENRKLEQEHKKKVKPA